MAETRASQDSKKTFYIVLIVILILLNGFFAYNHWQARKEANRLTEEQTKLRAEYDDISAELADNQLLLDSLRGINSEMDSMLVMRQDELASMRAQIETLLKNKKDLDQARALIASLKKNNQQYIARIDSLSNVVQSLTMRNDSLIADRETLLSEKDMLLSERTNLSKKVELSSLLIPENVEAHGVFNKSNDREVPTNKSKKTERLKICFDVPENRGVDAGEKRIVLRILNPQGATIAVASQGSGTFTKDMGVETQYTTVANFNYKNQKQRVCTYWNQTQAYGSGEYQIFFYQNGHELGSSSFSLK